MKKLFVLALAAALLVSLTACGGSADEQVITRATEAPGVVQEEQPAETAAAAPSDKVYAFESDGVKLVPGAHFDASKLPEVTSTYEAPSCAVEGMNTVYNYNDAFEVTTFDEGNGEIIYSIYLLDPNITTPEGLALGDDVQTALDLLGDGYEEDGAAYTYRSGETMLVLILEGDTVASIEYRLDMQ